jgi:unsaturated chondroitin disaccharide hydrolase
MTVAPLDLSIDAETLEEGLDAMTERVDRTRADVVDFPFVCDPETGAWETTDDGDWCGGHWVGLLRIAAVHATDPDASARLNAAADEYTRRMEAAEERLEWMFAGMNLLYAGFRSYDITGDRRQFGLGLTGADSIVDLFHDAARQVPVGDIQIEGPAEELDFREEEEESSTLSGERTAAVDNVYVSINLLWRAYRETGDPMFRDVALAHTDQHVDWFL